MRYRKSTACASFAVLVLGVSLAAAQSEAEGDSAMSRVPDFELLFRSVPGLYLVLTPALEIVAVSDAYLHATMTNRFDIIGRRLFDVFPDNPSDPAASGVKHLGASLQRVLQTKQPDTMAVQKYDIRRSAERGGQFEERYWSPINAPVLDECGDLRYIIHRVEDVTDYIRLRETASGHRTQMESEIYVRGQEIQKANEQLRAALAEKEILLKEVHHRVKNNLEVINSLLSLQADRVREPAARALLEDTCNQVSAIADIHRLLYRSSDLERVDVGQFLKELSHDLFGFYQISPERVALNVNVGEVSVNIQRAVPVALILNELLSNALKHAFPNNRCGVVHLTVQPINGENLLRVADDGVGLPEGFDALNSPSLGLQLVKVLCEQLGGRIDVRSRPGTCFAIHFPTGA